MLRTPYLNPFQPYPERMLDRAGEDRPRSAIENNMTRAVFSVLSNAERPTGMVALILQELVKSRCSPESVLARRIEGFCNALREHRECPAEVNLQSWPPQSVIDEAGENVFLIGISSDHTTAWTHDQRPAPENPCADAWISFPGKALLVFECKNDQQPLDATQMSSYAYRLFKSCSFPRVEPKETLRLRPDAEAVQAGCKDLVIDAPWSAVVNALKQIQQAKEATGIGEWLSGKAAEYIEWHVHPPYRGTPSILEWLGGPDTPDRREHLRTLLKKMGEALCEAAREVPDSITFDEPRTGAGAALYVSLLRGVQPLKLPWILKDADLVLWFAFHEQLEKRIGVEHYLQVGGAQPFVRTGIDPVEAWNAASSRHSAARDRFEAAMALWVRDASHEFLVNVSSVRFRGKKRNFQGSGVVDHEGPIFLQASPQDALEFVPANREKLWVFPKVDAADEISEAATRVRKPALSLVEMFDPREFAECGASGMALQSLLSRKVDAARR